MLIAPVLHRRGIFFGGVGVIRVYGLKTCDTCRKAMAWLKSEGIDFQFVDLRADGLSKADVTRFVKAVSWEKLLNKASTTWRGLDDEVKGEIDEAKAIKLMVEHPALIKRPVFEASMQILSGFKDSEKKILKARAR